MRMNRDELGRLAQDLKPYMAGWFGYKEASTIAASGSGSLEPHALNSTYHTGILGYDQAPWAVTDDVFASHVIDPNAHHYMATQGNGITINGVAQAVSVRPAATSGLSFDGTGGLQVDDSIAGSALVMASKILSLNLATNAGLAIASDALSLNLASPSGLQLVTNQLALADSIAGNGLSIASKVLAINLGSPSGLEIVADALQLADTVAGNGLGISSKVLSINLATPSGLEIVTDALQIADSIAGAGLGISAKILSVNAGVGLAISGDNVILGTPSTLNTTSTNVASGTTHQHQIDHRSNPGQASYILSTDANGELFLYRETISNRLQTPLINSAAGQNLLLQPAQYLDLDPDGALVRMLAGTSFQTDNYFSQTTGMRVSYLGEGDFRYLYADELHAKAFIADLEQALAGGQIISKSVAILAQDFTIPVTTTSTIAYRSTASATASSTSVTVTKPTGTAQYDVLIANVNYEKGQTITGVPTDWVLLLDQVGNTATVNMAVYYKVATAAEPANYTWTFSATSVHYITMSAYSGCETAGPIDAYGSQSNPSASSVIAPSITTTIANTMLVFVADHGGTSTTATLAGYNERADLYTSNHWVYSADKAQAAIGATGTVTATMSASRPNNAALIALKPATITSGTIVLKDLPSAQGMSVFQENDIIRLRSFSRAGGGLDISNCWGTVTGYTDNGDGTQSWTFQRSAAPNAGAMADGTVIKKDSIVLDYGVSGNGFYEVNAIDGIYGLNSPYMQIVNWTGHPNSGQTVRLRAGNLRGVFGIANEYGLYAGNGSIAPASTYLRLSTQALEFHNISSGWFNGSGTQTVAIDSGGTMWLGPSSADKRLSFDGTNLQLKGGLIVGPGLGFTTDALFYAGFDGSSIRGDSSGNPNGHLGQQATIFGAPRFRPGRYGKALEVSDAYTNVFTNPSFEADLVGAAPAGWSNHVSGTAVGTRAVTDEDSWDGAKSLKIAKTGGAVADQFGVFFTWAATLNTYYSISVRVKLANLVGATTSIANLASSTGLSVASTTYNTAGAWTELRMIVRATATGTARINLYLANCATGVMYVDAAMLYTGNTATVFYPPFWEANSTRAASYVRYSGVGIGNVSNTTFCGWFYLNDSPGTVGRESILFDLLQPDNNNNNRLVVYVNASNKFGINHTVAASGVSAVSLFDVSAGAWHHFAVVINGTTVYGYLDGVLVGLVTAAGYLINMDTLAVGSYYNGVPMNGLMDDFAIIPRALSSDEVVQIFSNANPLRPMSSPYEMQIWNRDSAGSLSKIAATGKGMFGSTINNAGVETVNFGFFNDVVASWGGFTGLAAGDVVIGRSAGNYIRYTNSTGLLSIKGAIQITSGSSGIGSFSDANLDNIANGATYSRTTYNQVTGADRAWNALDGNNQLITRVDPGTNWGANPGPGVAGLLLGGDYMGYWNGSAWKSYMDSAGRFYLNAGVGSNYLSWDGATLSVSGTIAVLGGSTGWATFSDVPGRYVTNPAPGTPAGLYITAANMGYWNGSAWNLYLTSGGQFYFGGTSGASLRWNGSKLSGYDSGNTEQWFAGSSDGRITFGNNRGTMGSAGISLLAASVFSSGDSSNLSFYSTLPATGLVAEIGAASGGFNNLNIRAYNNGTAQGSRVLIGTVVNGVYGAYAQATSSYVGGVWNHGWEFNAPIIIWNTATLYGPTTIANTLNVTSSLSVSGSGTFATYAEIGAGAAGYYQDSTNGAYRARVGTGTTTGYYFQTNGGGGTVMYIGLGGTYLNRVGINRTDPAYVFDVSGEGRITGTMRVEVALSMLPQASPPGVSAAYGILYVNASNQLCYIKKNGTSPGTIIVA